MSSAHESALQAHAMAAADRVLLEIRGISTRHGDNEATATVLVHLALANLFVKGVEYGSEVMARRAEAIIKGDRT